MSEIQVLGENLGFPCVRGLPPTHLLAETATSLCVAPAGAAPPDDSPAVADVTEGLGAGVAAPGFTASPAHMPYS